MPTAPMLRALLREHAGEDAEIALALRAWEHALEWLREHEPRLPAPTGWQWVPLRLGEGALQAFLLRAPGSDLPLEDVEWAHRAWSRTLASAALPPLSSR